MAVLVSLADLFSSLTMNIIQDSVIEMLHSLTETIDAALLRIIVDEIGSISIQYDAKDRCIRIDDLKRGERFYKCKHQTCTAPDIRNKNPSKTKDPSKSKHHRRSAAFNITNAEEQSRGIERFYKSKHQSTSTSPPITKAEQPSKAKEWSKSTAFQTICFAPSMFVMRDNRFQKHQSTTTESQHDSPETKLHKLKSKYTEFINVSQKHLNCTNKGQNQTTPKSTRVTAVALCTKKWRRKGAVIMLTLNMKGYQKRKMMSRIPRRRANKPKLEHRLEKGHKLIAKKYLQSVQTFKNDFVKTYSKEEYSEENKDQEKLENGREMTTKKYAQTSDKYFVNTNLKQQFRKESKAQVILENDSKKGHDEMQTKRYVETSENCLGNTDSKQYNRIGNKAKRTMEDNLENKHETLTKKYVQTFENDFENTNLKQFLKRDSKSKDTLREVSGKSWHRLNKYKTSDRLSKYDKLKSDQPNNKQTRGGSIALEIEELENAVHEGMEVANEKLKGMLEKSLEHFMERMQAAFQTGEFKIDRNHFNCHLFPLLAK